jgi:hypothetical protein
LKKVPPTGDLNTEFNISRSTKHTIMGCINRSIGTCDFDSVSKNGVFLSYF